QNGLFIVKPDGPIHSDFFPELEYSAQRGFFLNRVAERWRRFREDSSLQLNTLLTQYLRSHALEPEDFKALLRDSQEHRMPEPRLFRSLLLRWQSESNRLAFPVELRAVIADHTIPAEMRVIQLGPFLPAMEEQAITNAAALRVYTSDLMESYRFQRS